MSTTTTQSKSITGDFGNPDSPLIPMTGGMVNKDNKMKTINTNGLP